MIDRSEQLKNYAIAAVCVVVCIFFISYSFYLIKKVEEAQNLTFVKSSQKKQPNGLDIGLFRNSAGKLMSGRLLVGDCSKKLICVGLSNQTRRRVAV